jgi:hypothetical protein
MPLPNLRLLAVPLRRWPPVRSPQVCFGVGCVLAVLVEVCALFTARTVRFEGRRPIVANDVASGAVIGQNFVAPVDGLEAVTVYLRVAALQRPARVLFELLQVEQVGNVPLFSRIVPLPDRSGPLTFSFPALTRSEGQGYRLQLHLVEPAAGEVGIETFVEGQIDPGSVSIAGREQWADLRLRLTAESRYRAFLGRTKLTGWRVSPWLHMVLLALYNWALITFTYGILSGRADPGTGLVEPLGPP